MEKRKLPKKHIILLFCSAALLVVNLIFYSLGWFTSNKETETNGIGMQSVDCPFELITRGDSFSDSNSVPGHRLLENLDISDFGYINSDKTFNRTRANDEDEDDAFSSSMNWLLSDDSNFNNLTDDVTDDEEAENHGLKPGSHGKLEFWIDPVEDKLPMTVVCELEVKPYQIKEETVVKDGVSVVEYSYPPVASNNPAVNFLKGHILFFRGQKQITEPEQVVTVYSNIIMTEDGKIQFEVPIESAGEKKVEIYWVWPRTLPELLLDSRDPNLLGRPHLLVDIPAQAEGNSDKEIVVNVMKGKNSWFFRSSSPINDTLIENVANKNTYQKAEYIELCSAYNQADQCIGLNVQFVVLNLTCSVKQSG